MSQYSLRDAVASVLDTSDLASPEDVASKVAENVPSKAVRSVLTEALTTYVRVHMGERRRSNVILNGDEQRKQSARSSKVAAIRDSWSAALRDRVHVEDGWKALGECTYDNLMFAASERQEMARRNAAQAEKYESLAHKLRSAGVERVADLPQADLAELGSAA